MKPPIVKMGKRKGRTFWRLFFGTAYGQVFYLTFQKEGGEDKLAARDYFLTAFDGRLMDYPEDQTQDEIVFPTKEKASEAAEVIAAILLIHEMAGDDL